MGTESRPSVSLGLVLLLAAVQHAQPLGMRSGVSFRRSSRAGVLRRRVGDIGDSLPFCVLPPQPGFDLPVNVFADAVDNQRSVSFGNRGTGDGDGSMYIESMVKCAGSMPESCGVPFRNVSGPDGSPPACVECPCKEDEEHESSIYGNYQRKMIETVVPRCKRNSGGDPFRVLLIGLGGGALPQHILSRCPAQSASVEAVEYDPRMIEVATRFFGLHLESGVSEVQRADGGQAVAERALTGKKYDAVLVDAFAGGPHVPESCRNAVFVANLRKILSPNGFVLHNIEADTDGTVAVYEKGFGSENVNVQHFSGNGEISGEMIVAMQPM